MDHRNPLPLHVTIMTPPRKAHKHPVTSIPDIDHRSMTA
jgi:hypothetical protein